MIHGQREKIETSMKTNCESGYLANHAVDNNAKFCLEQIRSRKPLAMTVFHNENDEIFPADRTKVVNV